MNEEKWEKRVFTSIETEAIMSPSTEWRAQNYRKIYKKNTEENKQY